MCIKWAFMTLRRVAPATVRWALIIGFCVSCVNILVWCNFFNSFPKFISRGNELLSRIDFVSESAVKTFNWSDGLSKSTTTNITRLTIGEDPGGKILRKSIYKNWNLSFADQQEIEFDVDFSSFDAAFQPVKRVFKFESVFLDFEALNKAGIREWLYLYKVKSTNLPVTTKLPSTIAECKNYLRAVYELSKPETDYLLNGSSKSSYQILKSGEYVVGMDIFTNKNNDSQWLQTSLADFLPISLACEVHEVPKIYLEFETKERTIEAINVKPFTERSRECYLIRSSKKRNECLSNAYWTKECRRILQSYGLLSIQPGSQILTTWKETVLKEFSRIEPMLSFQDKMMLIYRPITSQELCDGILWRDCILETACTWFYDIKLKRSACRSVTETAQYQMQRKVLPEYDVYQDSFEFVDSPDNTKKYFVYQPSGGFNNQRIELEMALAICKITNRTCVLPHIAQHSNLYQGYNLIQPESLVSMQRIFDFQSLKTYVDVVSIPKNDTLLQWIEKNGGANLEDRSPRRSTEIKSTWQIVKPKTFHRKSWTDSEIYDFAKDESKYLFFSESMMWDIVALDIWAKYASSLHRVVSFARPIKSVVIQLADELKLYNAMHIRRGDKTMEKSFSSIALDAGEFGTRMAKYSFDQDRSNAFLKTKKLYIATDETEELFFNPIKRMGYSVIRWRDLNETKLLGYLRGFPKELFMDLLGMIEQLLCVYSNKFLGSSFSTFTHFILRMRDLYPDIAVYNTTVLVKHSNQSNIDSLASSDFLVVTHQPQLRKGLNFTSYTSRCNYMLPKQHKQPC